MCAAPPSTGVRAGFDTLLRHASQLPFDKLRAGLGMLAGVRVGVEAQASESSILSRPQAVSKDAGEQGRSPSRHDQVALSDC